MYISKRDKIVALVEQWRESGLTRRAFSVQHGICERTFYSWCGKDFTEAAKSSGEPEFIELASEPTVSEKSACPLIEIELPGGLRIKIY